jgi:hypothetical protein
MKSLKNNHGVAIIYVTLFLIVIGLYFLALGIDIGWMAYVRTQGQAAVDASALSAAAALPNYNSGGTKLADMVSAYSDSSKPATMNMVMTGSSNISVADVQYCSGDPTGPLDDPVNGYTCTANMKPADGVKVTKPYSTPLFFSRILNGGNNADITVSSTAWLGGPGAFCPTIPVALCAQNIGYNPPSSFTCNESLDATLIPNTSDSAGWWAPLGQDANAEWCQGVLNGTNKSCSSFSQTINLNNGQINVCQGLLQNKFASLGCFTPRKGQTAGIPGTQCDPGGDPELRKKCTVTLPIVKCGNSINQQQKIVGYASTCIKYIQDNPDAISKVNLECSATADAPGGGPSLGTYATRPALIK